MRQSVTDRPLRLITYHNLTPTETLIKSKTLISLFLRKQIAIIVRLSAGIESGFLQLMVQNFEDVTHSTWCLGKCLSSKRYHYRVYTCDYQCLYLWHERRPAWLQGASESADISRHSPPVVVDTMPCFTNRVKYFTSFEAYIRHWRHMWIGLNRPCAPANDVAIESVN